MKNDQTQTTDQQIEAMAIEMIDRVRLLVDNAGADNTPTTIADRLAMIAAQVGIEEAIQLFAGSLTEYTMGIVREGGARRAEVRTRIPATRGEVVDRSDRKQEQQKNREIASAVLHAALKPVPCCIICDQPVDVTGRCKNAGCVGRLPA